MKISRRKLLSLSIPGAASILLGKKAIAAPNTNQFKYFRPILSMATLLPPQTKLEDKFGGVPFGVPWGSKFWPVCKGCGEAMSLVAQLSHHPERLDLGANGRNMMVFICNTANTDNTYNFPASLRPGRPTAPPNRRLNHDVCYHGNNAVVVVNGDQLEPALAKLPEKANLPIPEARVIGWTFGFDKGKLAYPAYFEPDSAPSPLPDTSYYRGLKLGGLPYWIQGAGDHPYPGWRFVLQIPDTYEFSGSPPPADRLGFTINHFTHSGPILSSEKDYFLGREKSPWCMRSSSLSVSSFKKERLWELYFYSFGSGIGYVFLRNDKHAQHPPVGEFFSER